MKQEMQDLLERVLFGAFAAKSVVLPTEKLIAFNDYLADAGCSITRMEVTKTEGNRAGRRLEYDIFVDMKYEESRAIFMDPERSRAHVKEIVDQTLNDGGTYEFRVWAERIEIDSDETT